MAAACGRQRHLPSGRRDPIKTASRPNVRSGSANHGQGVLRGVASPHSGGAECAPHEAAAPVPWVGWFPWLKACLGLSAGLTSTCLSHPCPSRRMGSLCCLELAQSRQCSGWLVVCPPSGPRTRLGSPEGGLCPLLSGLAGASQILDD